MDPRYRNTYVAHVRCPHLDVWYLKNIVYANLIEEATIASKCT